MRTLYNMRLCPYCMRTRIVLGEKGLGYEVVEVDPGDKPDALLECNPKGRVPTLDDDGVVVYESHIIDEYLDERYPQPKLMPRLPVQRAKVRMLCDSCDSMLAPALAALKAAPGGEPSVRALDEVSRALDLLERELEGGDYLVGGAYGMADIELAPWAIRIARYGVPPERVPPRVQAWTTRLCAHPIVALQTADPGPAVE
jgi:glutathione S-transferase